ncbi:hypothetical protein [Fusobacterium perfoetens]|uniref:hypothetical protein n=1 Tax=Fusobacterium perfoetens TaxID=852 RepID=UPI001F322AB2|nr:hypothetical protein [Fusobacterium perfoetens]MCF2611614.1 hypothetical protein [Fusobacterium perfoetens]
MTFQDLKIELIKRKCKFIKLVKLDGRSYQYLHRECSNNNKKVIETLFKILEKL